MIRIGSMAGKRRSKYGAVSVRVDGHFFPSTREARRYGELKLLEKAGRIRNLRLQPEFPIVVEGEMICIYRADFQYEECLYSQYASLVAKPAWDLVVEDVKGVKTDVYKLKKKLVKATHGIEIREVK
jgi:hypothetical protein